jgi:hypothetical protein
MTTQRQAKHPKKPSPEETARAIHAQHDNVVNAVHAVLQNAGLHGVTVHSLHYTVAPEMMSGSPCKPPCDPDQTCTTSGGRWVCFPPK